MCGIAGVYRGRWTEDELPAVLARMSRTLLWLPTRAAQQKDREWARTTLLDGASKSDLFDRAALEPWLDEVLSGPREDMVLVWALVNLQIWWECFLSP